MISQFVLAKRRWRRRLSRTQWVAKLIGRKLCDKQSSEPGLLIIQIDGLSRTQFENALANGRMPFLNRLIKSRYSELISFYSGLPSTTPAVQAEVMFAQRTAVPAFQFLNRDSQKMAIMYEQVWAMKYGHELAQRNEPLLRGGRSYGNIYTAGADEALLCAERTGFERHSRAALLWKLPFITALYGFTIARIALLALLELILAVFDFLRGLLSNQDVRAEFHSLLSRIGVSIVMREWLRNMLKISIAEGAPIIYGNFLGYDEQAHRRGPDSSFAHWVLKGIDNVIRDAVRTAYASDARDYEVIVFSDHGQERTTIYDKIIGHNIHEAVKRVFADNHPGGDKSKRQHETRHHSRETDFRSRGVFRDKGPTDSSADSKSYESELLVTALGPLGHIYVPYLLDDSARSNYANKLVTDQKIPLVLYKTSNDQLIAQNSKGQFLIPQDIQHVIGEEHPFIHEVAEDIRALVNHPDSGDMLLSGYNCDERPISFAQENGGHGSCGPDEVRGFAMIPHAINFNRRLNTQEESYLRGQDLYEAAQHFLERDRGRTIPSFSHRTPVQSDTIRVLTYNIHSCVGIDNKLRPERIISVIRSSQADIVCLQEVDMNRARTGRREQAALIASALSMSHHFYAVGDWGTEKYGMAIISRYPLEHIQSTHLTAANPQIRAEARGALWVSIDTPGGKVNVINTHFGLNSEERLRQAQTLLGDDWLKNVLQNEPVILCGDFNAVPRTKVWKFLTRYLSDSQLLAPNHRPLATFASVMPLARIDHIFINSHFEVKSIDRPVTHTARIASDHLPLCVHLKLHKTD